VNPIEDMLRLSAEQPLVPLRTAKAEGDPLDRLELIAQTLHPALLAAAVEVPQDHGADYFLYLGLLLKEAGNPTDPLHKMLVWQTAVAHFKIGKLHRDAAQAKDRATAEACCNAALGLTLELRKLVVALADYRERSARAVMANMDDSVECAVTKPATNATSAVEAAKTETAAPPKERNRGAPQHGSHGKHLGVSKTPTGRTSSGRQPAKSREARANCSRTRTPSRVRPGGSVPGKVHRTTGAQVKGARGKKRRPATKDTKSARQLRADLDELASWSGCS
jgi:hypothetical protein